MILIFSRNTFHFVVIGESIMLKMKSMRPQNPRYFFSEKFNIENETVKKIHGKAIWNKVMFESANHSSEENLLLSLSEVQLLPQPNSTQPKVG